MLLNPINSILYKFDKWFTGQILGIVCRNDTADFSLAILDRLKDIFHHIELIISHRTIFTRQFARNITLRGNYFKVCIILNLLFLYTYIN